MKAVLLVAREGYHLYSREYFIEWKQEELDFIGLHIDAEKVSIRIINAAANGISLRSEFKREFNYMWTLLNNNNIDKKSEDLISKDIGRTKIVLWFPDISLAYVNDDMSRKFCNGDIFEAQSIDEVKNV